MAYETTSVPEGKKPSQTDSTLTEAVFLANGCVHPPGFVSDDI